VFSFACVLRLSPPSRKTLRPHIKVITERKQVFKERVRPLAATIIKKSHGRDMQSFLRAMLQNLWAGVVRARPPPICQANFC